MAGNMTVKELGKLITEMKKKGLANAEISMESCDGCIVDISGMSVSNGNKNHVIIRSK